MNVFEKNANISCSFVFTNTRNKNFKRLTHESCFLKIRIIGFFCLFSFLATFCKIELIHDLVNAPVSAVGFLLKYCRLF